MEKILVTGSSGFIGYHLSKTLLERGAIVIGIDNMNSYYDVSLKEARLTILRENPNFHFVHGNIEDRELVRSLIKGNFDVVVNLAAQAGVRYSLTHPEAYISSNLLGFFNIIDACKEYSVPHFVFASSSSVYGANEKLPFSEDDKTDSPVSLYAATKKSNELIAHSYSHMFGLKTTGFRFFTVYGPYGRPDMALFKFTRNILNGKPIEVFNNGDMSRDFTYVDDIISGILALMEKSVVLRGESIPHCVYNIGNSNPVSLMDFIHAIEDTLEKKALIEFKSMQVGDVKNTYADTTRIQTDTGYSAKTDFRSGIAKFVNWYKEYYRDETASALEC